MQGRFATMSDAIIGRSAPAALSTAPAPLPRHSRATSTDARARAPCAVDEMGHRIDELENSIGELMAQAGIDEEPADGAPGAPAEPQPAS